ncbi:MAG: zinc ribbon domain-containing protein [Xanthomonadales bacterium]|nr:zinc ribbon domain-containing protein [Xanthomonadales bacterium]
MPIYEYRPEGAGCAHCQDGIEVFLRADEAAPSQCPHCGAELRQLISAPTVVSGQAHVLKESHFAERGFTQYRKVGGGVYEKTAGKGPRYISDDGK